MKLDLAVQEHAAWKMKFRAAINKQASLDDATIAADNCCKLGTWMHGEGKARWGSRPEFVKALDKHRQFHVEAGKVARLINGGRFAEAQAALDGATSYSAASNDVGVALLALKKVVNAESPASAH